jgi:hypothetical protein
MFVGKKCTSVFIVTIVIAAFFLLAPQSKAADENLVLEITESKETTELGELPSYRLERHVDLGKKIGRSFREWWSEEEKSQLSSEVEVTLSGPGGQEVPIDVDAVSRDVVNVEILPDHLAFAGEYELVIKQGEKEERKNFLWGVLALNISQSSVRVGEQTTIDLAVLNESGIPFCAAPVWLKITSPSGKATELSTHAGQIQVTPECSEFDLTQRPDFFTQFSPEEEGRYILHAETEVGGARYSIERELVVDQSPDVHVRRTTTTRLYPTHIYPVGLIVKTENAWQGTIREPISNQISVITEQEKWIEDIEWEDLEDEVNVEYWHQAKLPSRVVTEGNIQYLEWDVQVSAQQEIVLGYGYDPPDTSPALLHLGPLQIGDWREPQAWQLAVDVVTIDSAALSTSGVHNNHQHNIVFTSDSNGYIFYPDGDGRCKYSKTTNGGTSWGAPVQVDTQTDCISVGVWYDQWTPGDTTGTMIHVITLDSGSSDVWYTQLNTSGDSLSTTLTVSGANQSGSLTANTNFAVITKSSTGSLYTAISDNTDSFMLRCDSSCTSNISNWTEAGTNPFDADTDYVGLMPLTSGDVLAVRWDISADIIHSREYEDGTNTWDAGGWVTVLSSADENQTYDDMFSFAQNPANSNIYMSVVEDASTLGTDDVKAFSYDGTSWATLTDIATDTPEGVNASALQFDENTSTLYATYINYRSLNAGSPYLKYSTDFGTTWSSEIGPLNDYALPIQAVRGSSIAKYRMMVDWYANNTIDVEATFVANTTASQDWIKVGQSGTAITSTTGGSNVYVGGAWTFARSASSADITQIVITDAGSVDAETGLSNLDLYYETSGTCTYDGTETLFGTATSFNGSEQATVTGTMSVGTSQVCVYAVVDVGASALGSTMMFEITNPNTDVTVSAGNVPLEARVRLPGLTNLNGTRQTTEVLLDNAIAGNQNNFFGPAPAVVFTSDSTGYSFYQDSGGNCVYRKTTNSGSSWGSPVTVDSINTTDCVTHAVWYDQWTPGDTSGTVIHIATFDATDVYYTSLNTSGDTLSTTINASSTNQGGSFTSGANFIGVTKGTNGALYMSIADNADSFMLRCTTTCTTASNWTEAGTNPFTVADNDYQMILPQASDNIMAIYWEAGADTLRSQLYTYSTNTWSGAWTTIETGLLENSTYDASFGAVVDKTTYNIYLGWVRGQEVPGFNDEIRTAVYSSGSWTLGAEVISDTSNSAVVALSMAYDQLSQTVWAIWSQEDDKISRTLQNYYVSSSSDGMTTWSTPVRINVTPEDRRQIRTNYLSETRLYATWNDYVPDDLYGNTIYDIPVAITVSGNAYQSDGTTVLTECDGAAQNIKLYAEGRTYTTTCDDTTGAWSFTNVFDVEAENTLAVWYEGMSPNGSSVIVADTTGSNITGLKLSTDRVWIVNESTIPLTNALMGTYDSDNDADINFTVTGSNVVLASSTGLILRSKTSNLGVLSFDPGGTVTIPGLFTLQQNSTAEIETGTNSIGGTLSLETGTTLTIKGNTTIQGSSPAISTAGTATLTSSGTPTVTVEGTGDLGGGSNALTFYNLQLSATSGTLTLNSPLTVQNTFTVGNGSNSMTFNNESNDETINVDGNFTIAASGTFTASSTASQTFAGNWVNSGTFTAGNSTITLDGTSGTKTLTGGSSAFYNLTINDGGGSVTQQLGGVLDVDNDLTITGGTLDVSGSNHGITVGGDWNNDDILVAGTGTVTLDGSGTLTLDSGCSDVTTCTSQDFYNLTINQPSNSNTMSLTNTHLRVGNTLTITRGILSQGTFNIRALGTTAVSIAANGTWENISTGDISLGGNLTNAGTLTFKANNTCGGSDDIVITATTGTPSWSGAGTFELRDVSLANQDASASISVFSGTNAGGNTGNWTFYSGCTAGSLTADIVDSGGTTVTSPILTMGTTAFSLVPTNANGTFGIANEKLRVSNTTTDAAWSLSIAADAGPTATWDEGGANYDFNDPTGSAGDGGDTDSYGGQMTVDPGAGTVTPQGGCSNTGVSLGSSAAFDEDAPLNSITLVSASLSADTSCYWDVTGIDISQSIPAEQTDGNYDIDMTITAVAM